MNDLRYGELQFGAGVLLTDFDPLDPTGVSLRTSPRGKGMFAVTLRGYLRLGNPTKPPVEMWSFADDPSPWNNLTNGTLTIWRAYANNLAENVLTIE